MATSDLDDQTMAKIQHIQTCIPGIYVWRANIVFKQIGKKREKGEKKSLRTFNLRCARLESSKGPKAAFKINKKRTVFGMKMNLTEQVRVRENKRSSGKDFGEI